MISETITLANMLAMGVHNRVSLEFKNYFNSASNIELCLYKVRLYVCPSQKKVFKRQIIGSL